MLRTLKIATRPISHLPFIDTTWNPFHSETCRSENVCITTCLSTCKHVAIWTF